MQKSAQAGRLLMALDDSDALSCPGGRSVRVGGRDELDADDAELRALVADLAPPGYLADMGYLPYSGAMDAAVECLRAAVRDASGAVTAYGYGPRFWRSTGQLHKGRPATGLFLQLVHAPGEDVEIPGEPYSFEWLIDAQGDGDLDALRAHGQPAARVVLHSDDPVRAIDDLVARLR